MLKKMVKCIKCDRDYVLSDLCPKCQTDEELLACKMKNAQLYEESEARKEVIIRLTTAFGDWKVKVEKENQEAVEQERKAIGAWLREHMFDDDVWTEGYFEALERGEFLSKPEVKHDQ